MKKIITLLLMTLSISIPIQAQTIYTETIEGSRRYVESRDASVAVLEIKLADNNFTRYIINPLIVVEDFDSGLMGKENPGVPDISPQR